MRTINGIRIEVAVALNDARAGTMRPGESMKDVSSALAAWLKARGGAPRTMRERMQQEIQRRKKS